MLYLVYDFNNKQYATCNNTLICMCNNATCSRTKFAVIVVDLTLKHEYLAHVCRYVYCDLVDR